MESSVTGLRRGRTECVWSYVGEQASACDTSVLFFNFIDGMYRAQPVSWLWSLSTPNVELITFNSLILFDLLILNDLMN
jgi:hypothetical protein